MNTETIAIVGAGGKMGCRVGDNLRRDPRFIVKAVETGAAGRARLGERGLTPIPAAEALPRAGAVVLAVPDAAITGVAAEVIPMLSPGALVISLDPAGLYAGVIPIREDLGYFVSHPCHPPIFANETTPEAQVDYFGGTSARQSVVSALHRGRESDFARGEEIAKVMFGPILRAHRITVEQMIILEPGVVESTTSSLLMACKEALDEAIRMGVPAEAARDFVLGHLQVQLAVIFGFAKFPFSDGANLAILMAQTKILRDGWKDLLRLENIRASVWSIVGLPS